MALVELYRAIKGHHYVVKVRLTKVLWEAKQSQAGGSLMQWADFLDIDRGFAAT